VLRFINTPIAEQDSFFTWLKEETSEALWAGELEDFSSNMLREILCERNDKYRIGAGKLILNGADFEVKPQEGFEQLAWTLDARFDEGREVLIKGVTYEVSAIVSSTQGTFSNDTMRYGEEVEYYLGAVPVGDPWIEYVPTPLIILGGQEGKLGDAQRADQPLVPLANEVEAGANLEAAMRRLSLPLEPSTSEEASARRKKDLTHLQRLEALHQKKIESARATFEEAAKTLEDNTKKRSAELGKLLERDTNLTKAGKKKRHAP
jgi:hypothetical protein